MSNRGPPARLLAQHLADQVHQVDADVLDRSNLVIGDANVQLCLVLGVEWLS